MTVRLREPARSRVAAMARTEYEAGADIRSIAARIGLSYTATRQLLLSAGVQLRPRFGTGIRPLDAAEADARTRRCPYCGVTPGQRCRSASGSRWPAHASRRQAPPASRS